MLLRGVPDAVKAELAEFAKADGKSLSQTTIDILRKGVAIERRHRRTSQPKDAWEMLRSVFEEDGPSDGEFARIMDEVEAERKRDFGRPFDFDAD